MLIKLHLNLPRARPGKRAFGQPADVNDFQFVISFGYNTSQSKAPVETISCATLAILTGWQVEWRWPAASTWLLAKTTVPVGKPSSGQPLRFGLETLQTHLVFAQSTGPLGFRARMASREGPHLTRAARRLRKACKAFCGVAMLHSSGKARRHVHATWTGGRHERIPGSKLPFSLPGKLLVLPCFASSYRAQYDGMQPSKVRSSGAVCRHPS